MPEIRPFRALRYNPGVAGDIAAVVAPPYDVIDRQQQEALYTRSPFNAVRLILARDPDRYAAAAAALAEWQRRQVLVLDEEPSLYLYVQDYSLPGGEPRERTGIIGAVRLESFGTGLIRPHEKTLAAPKADRLRLLEACQVNLSPVFGILPGDNTEMAELRQDAAGRAALIDLFDAGIRQRLWRLSEPETVAPLQAALASRRVLIADGHHRYETALAYRDRLAAGRELAADDPANFVMMFLCSMEDPGLAILPTHRVLKAQEGFDGRRFLEQLRRHFSLRAFSFSAGGQQALLAALGAVEERGRMAVAIRGDSHLYLAVLEDGTVMDRVAGDLSRVVRRLDVSVLDRLVLRQLIGVEPAAAARDGRLDYVTDATEVFGAVARGAAAVAFLLNPTGVEEIEAVCQAGDTMPEKSTYFYPKLLTGMVFYPLRRAQRGNQKDVRHP